MGDEDIDGLCIKSSQAFRTVQTAFCYCLFTGTRLCCFHFGWHRVATDSDSADVSTATCGYVSVAFQLRAVMP
jgi:hypothetical protein